MDDLEELDDIKTLRTKYSELATLAGSLAHEIKKPAVDHSHEYGTAGRRS